MFSGGLSEENVNAFVEGLDNEKANKLRENLRPHTGLPPSFEPQEDSGVVLGSYTEEEADGWITEYQDAVSEGAR